MYVLDALHDCYVCRWQFFFFCLWMLSPNMPPFRNWNCYLRPTACFKLELRNGTAIVLFKDLDCRARIFTRLCYTAQLYSIWFPALYLKMHRSFNFSEKPYNLCFRWQQLKTIIHQECSLYHFRNCSRHFSSSRNG